MARFIDTNVFVSGIFWKGAPHKVLEAWMQGRFKLIICPSILTEYWRVVDGLMLQYPGLDASTIMELVNIKSEMVTPIAFVRPICTDPDDDKFLGAAVAAKAPYVVTGDKALLKVGIYNDVHVVTPAQFLRVLK